MRRITPRPEGRDGSVGENRRRSVDPELPPDPAHEGSVGENYHQTRRTGGSRGYKIAVTLYHRPEVREEELRRDVTGVALQGAGRGNEESEAGGGVVARTEIKSHPTRL